MGKVKCEVNPQALASHRQKWWKVVKRETAPASDSAQYILAWRSKDSVDSVGSSQSEAQPGNGRNASPGAAQSGGSKKPGARAVTLQSWNYARQAVAGRVWSREKWGDIKGVRRSDTMGVFFPRTGEKYKSNYGECHWTRYGLKYERLPRGEVWKKVEDKGRCRGVLR